MSHRDALFNEPIVKQFEFDSAVAAVFDDMVSRSVPYYKEVQELIVKTAQKVLKEGDKVYDLGCSTASTLLALEHVCHDKKLQLFGIDNSHAMITQARLKLQAYESSITLIEDDITTTPLNDAQIIISNYTLQFVRPMKRAALVAQIFSSLKRGGMLILSEKVIASDKTLDKAFIDIYYEYKKSQGYSSTEIMQKREALENVLVPYTYDENVQMLKDAGFETVETLFRWVNFTTLVAVKAR